MSGFGDKLKELRDKKNITQEKLSELTGLTQSAISQFEKGLRAPTPSTVDKIAKELGVEKGELFPKENYERTVLMRTLKGLSPSEVKEVTKFAEYIKSKKSDEEK